MPPFSLFGNFNPEFEALSFPEMELIGETTSRKVSWLPWKDLSLVAESSLFGHKMDCLGDELFLGYVLSCWGSFIWRAPESYLKTLVLSLYYLSTIQNIRLMHHKQILQWFNKVGLHSENFKNQFQWALQLRCPGTRAMATCPTNSNSEYEFHNELNNEFQNINYLSGAPEPSQWLRAPPPRQRHPWVSPSQPLQRLRPFAWLTLNYSSKIKNLNLQKQKQARAVTSKMYNLNWKRKNKPRQLHQITSEM